MAGLRAPPRAAAGVGEAVEAGEVDGVWAKAETPRKNTAAARRGLSFMRSNSHRRNAANQPRCSSSRRRDPPGNSVRHCRPEKKFERNHSGILEIDAVVIGAHAPDSMLVEAPLPLARKVTVNGGRTIGL